MNSGVMYLYHDPVRSSYKISDFDVQSWRPGLREEYSRLLTALNFCKIVERTRGGGGTIAHEGGLSWDDALDTALEALDALENAQAALVPRVEAWFRLSWLGVLGVPPSLDACASCGKTLERGEQSCYAPAEGGVLCGDCAARLKSEFRENMQEGGQNFLLPCGPGARLYLRQLAARNAAASLAVLPDEVSFNQASALLNYLLHEAGG
jgi:DNA repair protein RecO (recombination protein O)